MKKVYYEYDFEIDDNGNLLFLANVEPDRFFMKPGDIFMCETKDGKTSLIKIANSDELNNLPPTE